MMRYLFAAFLGLGVTCIASTGRAQSDSGFAFGLRAGYAIPMGKAGLADTANTTNTSSDKLQDSVKGMIPLWFDVGYRISPALYAGAFFQYGFALINKDQNEEYNHGFSCSAHDIALGANVHYHILPDASFDPWLGAGLGYEFLTANVSGPFSSGNQTVNVDASATLKGFQFLILEAGGDFKATPALAVGPFVNFAIGEYTRWSSTASTSGISQDQSGDVQDTGVHEWLTIGVRGQYNL